MMSKPALACSRPYIRSLRGHRGFHFFECLVVLLAALHLLELHLAYRHSYHDKYLPTDFTSLALNHTARHAPMFDALTPREASHDAGDGIGIGNQYEFQRDLGSGWEGQTQLFRESSTGKLVVVKRFTTRNSPLRNCVPVAIQHRFNGEPFWPSEIPAALAFGGYQPIASAATGAEIETELGHDFLPVHDYFLSGANDREWHLVTPFIEGGTLSDLAERIRRGEPRNFRELDNTYRPLFHRLLASLDTMHRKQLCHDDVKLENIFVPSDSVWLIGDFGNIREFNHPFHATRLWTEARQWPDCALNDVHRALKVYLLFLYEASSNQESFAEELFAGREPWSRLFWSFEQSPMHANSLWYCSERAEPPGSPSHYVTAPARAALSRCSLSRWIFGQKCGFHDAVATVLDVRIHDTFAWFIGLGWLTRIGPTVADCSPVEQFARHKL